MQVIRIWIRHLLFGLRDYCEVSYRGREVAARRVGTVLSVIFAIDLIFWAPAIM